MDKREQIKQNALPGLLKLADLLVVMGWGGLETPFHDFVAMARRELSWAPGSKPAWEALLTAMAEPRHANSIIAYRLSEGKLLCRFENENDC